MNIAEILKNCPEGTKLYSPVFGEVEFTKIHDFLNEIICHTSIGIARFYSDGTYYKCGECMLFPSKEQRDWDEFLIPFKDGDIIIRTEPNTGCDQCNIAIFNCYNNNSYNKMTIHCQINGANEFRTKMHVNHRDWRKANTEEINWFTERMHQEGYYFIDKELVESFNYGDIVAMYNEQYDHTHVAIFNKPISENYSKIICTNLADTNIIKVFGEDDCWRSKDIRKATRKEVDFFFKLLEEQGYKWDGKELTKGIKPKFKVGDIITNNTCTFKIAHIDDKYYYEDMGITVSRLCIQNQDEWKLKKFDIRSLKPYDRVLVRFEDGAWYPTLVSYVNSSSQVYLIDSEDAAECVIPFEGNEHLIGKFDDPDSFYITWQE